MDKNRPPAGLGATARREWRRLIREYDKRGALDALDFRSLYAYCEAWGEFYDLGDQLKETGPLAITEKGNYIQHPLLGAKNTAAQRMLHWSKELGLTPNSRARIGTKDPKGDDDLTKFLKTRKKQKTS